MKRLLITFAFTLFCLSMPLLMAQASAQEEPVSITKVDDGVKMKIELEGLNENQKERIEEIVEGLGSVFGEKAKAEIELELSELTELERVELEKGLEELFDGNNINVSGHDFGFLEALVAIFAISLTLGLPVIILLVVFIFAQKKRRQKMELVGMYVNADQPMPAHVLAELDLGMTAEKRLRTGLQLIFVGIALIVVLGTFADEAAVFGLIPVGIGLSRLIYWRYETKSTSDKGENDVDQ